MKNKLFLLFGIIIVAIFAGCQLQNENVPSPTTQENTQAQTQSQAQTQTQTQSSNTQATQSKGANTVNIAANKPFTLKVGQTATFKPNGSTIRFDSVDADSRCPQSVQCVWQGEAVLKVTAKGFLATTDDAQTGTITTNKTKIDLGGDAGTGYSLELVDLKPYPKEGQTTLASEYVATFKLIVSQS